MADPSMRLGRKVKRQRDQSESAMRVEVKTNLDQVVEIDRPGLERRSYRKHASTVILADEPEPSSSRYLQAEDGWDHVLVRSRLLRMAEVFRQLPHTPDTKPGTYRSCMPEPVREIFKDQPGEPMRLPVSRVDYAAAMQVLDSLIALPTRLEKVVLWHVANNISNHKLASYIRRDRRTAAKLKQQLLERLAARWNEARWPVEPADLVGAQLLTHRNLSGACSTMSQKYGR